VIIVVVLRVIVIIIMSMSKNIKISKTPNTVTRAANESPYHEQMMEKVKKAMARYI